MFIGVEIASNSRLTRSDEVTYAEDVMFVLMKTTCTAANLGLELVFIFLVQDKQTSTYVEVAPKTSINLPSVMNHKQIANMAVNPDTRPNLIPMAVIKYSTTIAETGKREAMIVPRNSTTL